MAYDFIPNSAAEIEKEKAFKSTEYSKVYTYLFNKFKKKDPIALSKTSSEMKMIKITRSLQSVLDIKQLHALLKLNDVKLSFGEGSRGGRGVKNKGGQFEVDLTKDLITWWEGGTKYTNNATKPIIEELSTHYGWNKKSIKKFDVKQMGELNQKRPLIFSGKDAYIGTAGDPNIGKTVTDITVMADKKPIYLSLKATGTVTFFNAGVARIFIPDEMKKHKTVKNVNGLALLQILGIDPVKFTAVFNSYGTGVKRFTEDVTKKIDRPRMIKLLKSGIGYGFHYIHAKKPTEIHHFEMTKTKMASLANPMRCVAYYGGKTSGGKRIDIEVDTPNITLKFNIRNKQGGVYPSHIMCDYVFKKY